MSSEGKYYTYPKAAYGQAGADAAGASQGSGLGASDALGADAAQPKARVVVFDFDGTSMKGNSPVLLVRQLIFERKINMKVALRIGFWGLAYKMRLPQNEAWVRGEVFKAFEGQKVEDADAYLRNFYDRVIAPRFRPNVDRLIDAYHQQGMTVLVISASFEPIIKRMMETHRFDGQVSTKMAVAEDGTYTRRVEGLPIEGDAKPQAIKSWCNARFGEGRWEVAFAYGDHHSDVPMLQMAVEQAYAVSPDNALEREAKQRGWTVLDW